MGFLSLWRPEGGIARKAGSYSLLIASVESCRGGIARGAGSYSLLITFISRL